MTTTVCLGARALSYPTGGGHLWVYLNWALGLKTLGCRVLWLEQWPRGEAYERLEMQVALLRLRLRRFGLTEEIVLAPCGGEVLPRKLPPGCVPVQEIYGADLLLNQIYEMDADIVRAFRRSALLDIDPGLLQIWMHGKVLNVAPHDLYFTIGETIGKHGSAVPSVDLPWLYTRPSVALDSWPVAASDPGSAFTTVTHWYSDEWVVDGKNAYLNNKRSSFLEYLELPVRVSPPIEIAACFGEGEEEDRNLMQINGWRIRDSGDVAGSPEAFQRYIQGSRAEFSCAKPSCMRLQNAWVSDRTLCYLASGRPVVVQYTGASEFLPQAEGMFRFRSIEEAALSIERVAADYERHARCARKMAEEYFDARKVVGRLLEQALS